MDTKRQLDELLDLAEHMNIEVRFAFLGDQPGGLCRLRNKWLLCVNDDLNPMEQVETLAKALAGRPEIEELFVLPEIRELLESYRVH